MPTFLKQWKELHLVDSFLQDLEIHLCTHPLSGDVIPGSGGLRKLRWTIPGTGKRAGLRILYVDFSEYAQTFMITCYKKAKIETISQKDTQRIKQLIQQIKTNLEKPRTNQ